ncbi:MAG: SDR family NAD(P)-dependent oxidoreductase [Candidatus Amulumruptor caecigallinarius]|nr:SDR family NAD(P)-dependent oxidoreductase [Candidatus Amulumruptor caecigallinarius]
MKKVLIMGASSGIGLRCAEALASRGIKVGLAARHVKKFKALKDAYPSCVEYMEIDVTKKDAVGRINKLISHMGGLDIYLHVSGIGYENMQLDPELEVNVFETNLVGLVRCVCGVYQYFRDNKVRGHIAVVTSVAGTNGIGRLSAYSASKAGAQKWLVALEQLSNNTGAGITFTDIRPGWIRTPLVDENVKYPMEMDLDYAVPLIIKAIVRKPRVAVIDCRWNLVVGLWRLIPNCIYTHLDIPMTLRNAGAEEKAEEEARQKVSQK